MKNKNECLTMPAAFRPYRSGAEQMEMQQERAAMKNKNIFQSMRCAFQGMQAAWKEERNFREYTELYAGFLLCNLLLGASVTEILIGFALVCGIFGAEYFNTALERLLDTKHPEISADNKFIKDTAAAGVFIISIAFFLSQAVILLPKLIEVIL